MRILSFKPGHDGQIALVEDGTLVFSLEGEKDSFPRLEAITPRTLSLAFERLDSMPDVVCESGWVKGWDSLEPPVLTGYHGTDPATAIRTRQTTWLGTPVRHFSSSHERSHILCAYGMSPWPQGEPCYALVWEGAIGDFFSIDASVNITRIGRAMFEPGSKYSVSFFVADNRPEPLFLGNPAGKVMALAAYGCPGDPDADERAFMDYLFSNYKWLYTWNDKFVNSPFYHIGVESQKHKDLARKVSDRIYDTFYRFALEHLEPGRPLLISGGCGLNCEWNSRLKSCGLFSDVFVPPCTNDSGSAIGTAVDAQLHYTGRAKIDWTVYAGLPFEHDIKPDDSYLHCAAQPVIVAELLDRGAVIGWVSGRWEIGPRALGHRSLLAAPFTTDTRDRLNTMKRREAYRPIAPVCLEEDVSQHFDWSEPSPYMLHFQRVRNQELRAVTHVDGSARVQTITRRQDAPLTDLLLAFRKRTGCAVLCNTSLNFPGTGFINRMSDLVRLQRKSRIDAFTVDGTLYVPRDSTFSSQVVAAHASGC